jgi:hypothetical protein
MDANFERMLAQAVRGHQVASPPQEPTVPDKCVPPYNLILLLTRPPQWRSYTYLIACPSKGWFPCVRAFSGLIVLPDVEARSSRCPNGGHGSHARGIY